MVSYYQVLSINEFGATDVCEIPRRLGSAGSVYDEDMEHAELARRYRCNAEECRMLADIVKEPRTQRSYLRIAENYELLAKQEDTLSVIAHEAAMVDESNVP
jgi:hypothetical protein